MVDLLITGGGIAGSALAILPGRQEVTADLYERSRFPGEKPWGEGLMPSGVAVPRRAAGRAADNFPASPAVHSCGRTS